MEITPLIRCKAGTRNVNLIFIVLEVSKKSTTTKEGNDIRTCKVGDRTACINLAIWGELGDYVQPGDILRLTNGYVAPYRGKPTLYVAKGGELVKTGEFSLPFNEAKNMSEACDTPIVTPASGTTTTAGQPAATSDNETVY